MPERCRVGVCGFDPMLVKGYVTTGFRGLWWHISDELYEGYNVKPNDNISGTLHRVYKGATKLEDVKVTHEPNVDFEWDLSKESGLAVLLPPKVIVDYQLTEFHFIEVTINKINDQEVWAGEDKTSVKMWPEDRMELPFVVDYIGPKEDVSVEHFPEEEKKAIPPKRYFATRIEGGPEAAGLKPLLVVGKEYQCIFGIKPEVDPRVGIAEEIPPDVLAKMLERNPQVLAVGKGLEIRDSFVTLNISRQDYTSVEEAVHFHALKPGPCELQLLLMLDRNVVRSIRYDFRAVFFCDTIPDVAPAEQRSKLPAPEKYHCFSEKTLLINVNGGDGDLKLNFISAYAHPVYLPLNYATRRDLEAKKRAFLSKYANSMQHIRPVELTKRACDEFIDDLKALGQYIFEQMFMLPGPDYLKKTGRKMREYLCSNHPASIQINTEQEYLPWMFLSDGEGALGLRHALEHIIPGKRAFEDFYLTSRPLRMVCGVAPVFEGIKLEDDRSVVEVQRDALTMLAGDRFKVKLAEDEQQWLKELGKPADVIYAYCHGSSVDGESCLWMTRKVNAIYGKTILSNDSIIDLNRSPLVILAACNSGALNPFRARGLAKLFIVQGARGCIATEGEVPTTFASLFTEDLFKEFFVKGRKKIGDVLFNLRNRFLEDKRNPWGVLFTQFCRSEIAVCNDKRGLSHGKDDTDCE